ncbi:MAG: hypothetical protein ACYTBJ_23345 [Planctomycetota bacterium]|jgi:hypothetical protein
MLFSDTCKRIVVRKHSDLNQIVEHVKNSTFDKDNSTIAHECLSLYLFLIAAFKIEQLRLPIEISKDESPDFRLSQINQGPYLGLEHTRATEPKYKMDESEFGEYPEGSVMELPYYGSQVPPPKKSRVALKKPGEPLTSDGYGDDGREKQWTNMVLDAIKRKTQHLNADKFTKHARNELLVEDDGPADVSFRFDNAIKILKTTYVQVKMDGPLRFDKVHIYSDDRLVYDVFGQKREIPVSKSEVAGHVDDMPSWS